MSGNYELVLKSGTLVNQDGTGVRDVGIRDGRIAAIGSIDPQRGGEVIDARGLHILPGVIDTQVHFREPGLEHKEDLETGSRAAVLGGVTAVFEMPNTKPLTTNAQTLADKVARARQRMFCDFAFYVGGTRENVDNIPDL
ncbi:MAG: amidohydrolase family protein, partial [Hyphomicrobium sp.]